MLHGNSEGIFCFFCLIEVILPKGQSFFSDSHQSDYSFVRMLAGIYSDVTLEEFGFFCFSTNKFSCEVHPFHLVELVP